MAGLVEEAVPYAGATGIVGVVAFALKLLVTFQRDFTDRYATRLREQDNELAELHTQQRISSTAHAAELAQMREEHQTQMADERRHRRQCEDSLRRQGELLEALQVRLEQLDRRRYTRPAEPPEEMP